MDGVFDVTRRQLAALLVGGLARPGLARAETPQATRKTTLVIGLSISDTLTLDPARQSNYTPPLTLAATYDTLVTLTPGRYADPVPLLASKWEPTADGQGLRFTLKPGVMFSSGNAVTSEDWAFSFNRLLAIGGQPARFLDTVASVTANGPDTLDIKLTSPSQPILGILAAPGFVVLEKRALLAHGGTDQPGAGQLDKATVWLNQASAGTGPYVLRGWARNQQIELAANPHSWRGPPAYRSVVIQHMPTGIGQFRALKRGDIDVAFNLIPEQIGALQDDSRTRVESITSLDFVYLAVNGDPELNKALAVEKARQAIGYAIDYDGLLGRLLGGKGIRPAGFLPIGVRGSTETIARQVGFYQDLDKARRRLREAGLADGFTFELSYGNDAIAGLSYATIAHKIRSDLAQVGIKATLAPLDPSALRTRFLGGRLQAALNFWNPPAIETRLWAVASIERVARRVGATPSPALLDLVARAAAEPDPAEQQRLWIAYQKAMVDAAHLIALFQPIYQVAVSNTVAAFPLTAAGCMADLAQARPA